MRTRQVGQRGLLVECDDEAEVAAAYAHLRASATELGAVEVVPAARTVLLDGLSDLDAARAFVADLVLEPGRGTTSSRVVEIPTTYDGEDLDEVARQWGLTTAEVVRIHQESRFRVLFCGFAPGFAYCTGLPDGLTVRRRAEPRPRVPAGSVALAGEYTSVYPNASPGGWQLIGSTRIPVWRPGAADPVLLAPGTEVRFVGA